MITMGNERVNFANERESFFEPLRKSYWDVMYGEEYSLLDAYTMSEGEIAKARKAAQAIYDISSKAIGYLRMASDEELLNDLGIPEGSLSVIRMRPLSVDSVISRVDLVAVDHTYKAFEINSDTPTFIKECFEINGLIAEYFGKKDPNAGLVEKLGEAVRNAVSEAALKMGVHPMKANIVFTSHSEEESNEDFHTLQLLKKVANIPHATYSTLKELSIDEDGLYDKDGNKIDVLYRQTYPIEYLVYDEGDSGRKVGEEMLDLVAKGNLSIVNPPSAFLMQSKAVQAFIWEAVERNLGLFTSEESELVKEHFLPTYWDNDAFTSFDSAHYGKFVKKPVFGREGDTIDIFDPKDGLIHAEKERNYAESLPIFQKFAALPKGKIQTIKGELDAHLLVGVFVIAGKASAIGIRAASSQITNNLSYHLSVCVE